MRTDCTFLVCCLGRLLEMFLQQHEGSVKGGEKMGYRKQKRQGRGRGTPVRQARAPPGGERA